MNNAELREAMASEIPVVYGNVEYKRISAIICRKRRDGGIYIQAELEEKKAHCVVIVDAAKVCSVKQYYANLKEANGNEKNGNPHD